MPGLINCNTLLDEAGSLELNDQSEVIQATIKSMEILIDAFSGKDRFEVMKRVSEMVDDDEEVSAINCKFLEVGPRPDISTD